MFFSPGHLSLALSLFHAHAEKTCSADLEAWMLLYSHPGNFFTLGWSMSTVKVEVGDWKSITINDTNSARHTLLAVSLSRFSWPVFG